MTMNNKPLPTHDKRTAYIEISKAGSKFLCVLLDSSSRQPVRSFSTKRECQKFATAHQLDFVLVGGCKMSFSYLHTPLNAPQVFDSISEYPELCVLLISDHDVPEPSFKIILYKFVSDTGAFNLASTPEINRSSSFQDMFIEAHNLAFSLDIPFINHSSESM